VVIADDNGVESIGGIMGGEHSGCDENTTNVLIESALWNPMNIAKTGRSLGIITDARYRFERGVDPEYMVPAWSAPPSWCSSSAAAPSEPACRLQGA
jgi:phenylalanyl-tRNA synthetase beta chain